MKPETANRTALEWLEYEFVKLESTIGVHSSMYHLIEKAKEMEKEQIMRTARQCHFEGVRQSAKSSLEYIDYAEQYYKETFNTKEK
jgi:bisphosphoglycerate-independent phosphoglycerate mutase (AlkP superfamily)